MGKPEKNICSILSEKNEKDERYLPIKYEFEGNLNNQFKGIISRVGNFKAKSDFDNRTINISAVSCYTDCYR